MCNQGQGPIWFKDAFARASTSHTACRFDAAAKRGLWARFFQLFQSDFVFSLAVQNVGARNIWTHSHGNWQPVSSILGHLSAGICGSFNHCGKDVALPNSTIQKCETIAAPTFLWAWLINAFSTSLVVSLFLKNTSCSFMHAYSSLSIARWIKAFSEADLCMRAMRPLLHLALINE